MMFVNLDRQISYVLEYVLSSVLRAYPAAFWEFVSYNVIHRIL